MIENTKGWLRLLVVSLKISSIIRPNQTDFQKGVHIAFIARESMDWVVNSNQEMVMLLLDFERNYNTVEWSSLEETDRSRV